MEIVRTTAGIAAKIKHIVASGNGRRVAIVAFIGSDGLKLVGGPSAAEGLEVYCWDNPLSTRPQGIRDLFRSGAKIGFVTNLHMKIFWSEKAGYLVGSANLSQSALNDEQTGTLLELAVFDKNAAHFPVADVLRQLYNRGVRKVESHADIDEFAKRCGKQPSGRRNRITKKREAPSFDAYMQKGGPAFSYCGWCSDAKSSKREMEAAAAVHYKTLHTIEKPRASLVRQSIEVTKGKHHKAWILEFYIGPRGQIGRLDWLYAHTEVPRARKIKTKIEVRGISRPEVPPFELGSSQFKRRFSAFLKQRFSNIDEAEGTFNPSDFRRFENNGPD